MQKTNSKTAEIFLLALLILLLFNDYLFLTRELNWEIHRYTVSPVLERFHSKCSLLGRVAFVIIVLIELGMNFKKVRKNLKLISSIMILASAMFIFVDIFSDRIDVYLYPVLFLILFFLFFFYRESNEAAISAEDLNEADFKLSKELVVTKYSVNLRLHDGKEIGWLNMPNPFRGINIIGGAGSGKTFAVFGPIMFQFVMKDFVNFNYDYKFPDLTNDLQKYIDFREHAGKKNYPHYIVNFIDPTRSHRLNPIEPASIEDTIELTSIATVFIQNIKKEWVKNKDFWADAAIAYLNALMLYMYRNHPDKCTLPHVIELGCKPYGSIIDMLLSDPESAKIMVSYAQAVKDKAGAQLAGMSGSLQVFLPNLSKPSIYWTLSGNDFTLDFNNPENPHHISLGNDPGLRQQFLQPIIGCISKIALSKANRNYENLQQIKGAKNIIKQIPCGLFFDELVTTYIEDLDQIPNTGRSNLLSLVIGIQMSPQLIDKYGQDKYKVLMGSFGNLFAGLVNDPDSAKIISDIFGKKKVKIKSESSSKGQDGKESKSTSYSYQMEDSVPISTLTTQAQGHFYGKYTTEFDPKRDLKVELKKPFFKGTVLVESVNSYTEISDPLDVQVPITKKLSGKYMIPEFVKFSNAADYSQRQKDMKAILESNYNRIVTEVDAIIKDFQHKKDLQEITEKKTVENLLKQDRPIEDYLKDVDSYLDESTTGDTQIFDEKDFETDENSKDYFAS